MTQDDLENRLRAVYIHYLETGYVSAEDYETYMDLWRQLTTETRDRFRRWRTHPYMYGGTRL